MDAGQAPAAGGQSDELVSRVELLTLAVLTGVLLAGLALTALAPTAWPVPVLVLVGMLYVSFRVMRRARRSADGDQVVSAEAAAGLRQLESWLAQRDRT